ncbi:septum formation protein Maf [bacterium SCSIO 12643]|nr:septum formation protein Maf [bacterium SCSIO 12643]
MFKHLDSYNITLASNSPRRKQLLGNLGIEFKTRSSQGEETYPDDLPPIEVAKFLAIQKADWFTDLTEHDLYITADTIVIVDHIVLGKPQDVQEALEMIQQLAGKTHQVVTGVCIKSKNKLISFDAVTDVTFKSLSDETIRYYIDTYQPFDKAGSYGIQEWIGMIGITELKGSYFNVMGLPTDKLFDALKNF